MKKLLFLFFGLSPIAFGQAAPVAIPHMQFFDQNGIPCSGCSLFTYQAGTTTPQATFTDASGNTPNTNPVILNASGFADIWTGSTPYKFVLKNQAGTTVWTTDNVKSTSGSGAACGSANKIQTSNGSGLLACTTATADSSGNISTPGAVSSASVSATGSVSGNSVTGVSVIGGTVNTVVNPASGTGSYTADPTGVTDSTAAIQAAIDSATSNTVELPAGTFLYGSGSGANCRPVFLGNHTLRGQGQTATILKNSNTGCQTAITTWTCSRAVGSCTSGSGAMTLTLNFATPPFANLAGVDFNCQTVAGGCALVQGFGVNPNTPQYYGVFGGGLTGLLIGGPNAGADWPTFLGASPNPTTATSFQIAIDSGTPAANSGTGGTFVYPIPGMMGVYDARSHTNGTTWGISDLTFEGSCAACNTGASGWSGTPLSLSAGSYVVGGFKMKGLVQNVTFRNVAFDGAYLYDTNGITFRNIRCDTIGHDCIRGSENSNETIDTLSALNMGFPFQGSSAQQFTHAIENAFLAPGFGIENFSHIYFEPTANYPGVIIPFAIGGYQAGNSPDSTHKQYRGVTIRDLTMLDNCLAGGGMVSLFADNLLIDGVVDDHHNCASEPANGTGFVEIGGSNNRVTNGKDVHVSWAGIDSVYTKANNIQVDHISWNNFAPNGAIFDISGQQNGTTACEIDNVDIHDISATFDNSSGLHNSFLGLGDGEGSTSCAIVHLKAHDNVAKNINGNSFFAAMLVLGPGNGTINHSDWHLYNNQLFGFPNYLSAECNSSTTSNVGTIINNLYIDHETADNAIGTVVIDRTHTLPCTANNWTGVQTWGANNWAGKDYNLAHNGVSASITGVASTCVTGTAAIAQALVGGQGTAVRTDGAALQSGNSTRVNVAVNGTATVTVCSGTTLEPAGTYNVSVTNPQ